jgi:predicted HNH restriction endonuclease
MIAFALSILTAYIDLDTYFKQKARFRNSFWKHGPTMSFFLFNGVLAASMMIAAKSNGWITKDVWALALGVKSSLSVRIMSK